ncbi:hypothetical protein [Rhodosalinus halophilus]|uniref:hypothetical protein n=1 Tax=Rhodosalinus halophilus TaxID=2259333 RepID=UPI001F45A61E|nr:hypothetical protein [Rhodosalinus halophilus]
MATAPLGADPARVVDAAAEREGHGWRFSVTPRHCDTGWDDHADGWRVPAPSGEVPGTRELLHPHVTEQPFTRSLAGVVVPEGVTDVRLESSTTRTGWSGETRTLRLAGE